MDLWASLLQLLHSLGFRVEVDAAQRVGQLAGQLETAHLMALAAALGWASGLRLYAAVFLTGMAGATGLLALPPGLQVLQHPALLAASGAMLFVEFFVDKIPGLDSLWDMTQSVFRIPAGAALAAAVFGADNATMAVLAALLGGTLAASSQAAKTTTRAAINTSPEPFSNVFASVVEDSVVVAALWLAVKHPLLFGVLLAITVVLLAALTWQLFRFLRTALRRLSAFFTARAGSA